MERYGLLTDGEREILPADVFKQLDISLEHLEIYGGADSDSACRHAGGLCFDRLIILENSLLPAPIVWWLPTFRQDMNTGAPQASAIQPV